MRGAARSKCVAAVGLATFIVAVAAVTAATQLAAPRFRPIRLQPGAFGIPRS